MLLDLFELFEDYLALFLASRVHPHELRHNRLFPVQRLISNLLKLFEDIYYLFPIVIIPRRCHYFHFFAY